MCNDFSKKKLMTIKNQKMAIKTALKKDSIEESKPTVNQLTNKNIKPNMVGDKKQKIQPKKSIGIVAAAARSAVNQVKANYSWDIRGSGGLANRWAVNSYD